MMVPVLLILLALLTTFSRGDKPTDLMYSWIKLDYDWPNDTVKEDYITSKKFIVENNIITGIKVYKGEVYLTVPRWRSGIPSTLNRVIKKGGVAVLQPYPSWSYQTEGDCSALQYVQSMEIDPNTGLMWIIDNGRINFQNPQNLCPAKLVIYDIQNRKEVHRYTFPDDVANRTSCFLNDIVLDYVDGEVKFAYITDTSDAKLYVYNYEKDESYFFKHPSMEAENGRGTPIDGIAMSADFQFVYYCPITGLGLFQIPTSVLRDQNANFDQHVRRVGNRSSRADGLAYGHRNLYYGLLDSNGVNRWAVAEDAKETGYGNVTLKTDVSVARDKERMLWPDTFAWDDNGHLWFTANDLGAFNRNSMNFSGDIANMYVWKVLVNEKSYLTSVASREVTLVSIISWIISLFFCHFLVGL